MSKDSGSAKLKFENESNMIRIPLPQMTWKPPQEMLDHFAKAIDEEIIRRLQEELDREVNRYVDGEG